MGRRLVSELNSNVKRLSEALPVQDIGLSRLWGLLHANQ